ncbi:rhomboid family intramembrane serine protease [Nocardioides antri]|uniref:Rhomboid family intramembrane serine protease n=1 Tax=Nocardioides antri TaxID=2607659 RepID=A0A5B1M305_9ACTN|nr:rhomboid family intramembrane serine protease [Nocardioides antri]KAA1426798.1 rhomboid family intramembrane serine protease [Nocardioides antri]
MSDAPVGVPTCYRHPDRETYVRCQRCDKAICPDCMRDASVGFQCPDCVKEGVKSTRQAQAAYGGRRSANPALTSIVLVALNGLVWLAIIATGWKSSPLIHRLALVPAGLCESKDDPGGRYPLATPDRCAFATSPPGDGRWVDGVADGAYWQLLTSMFAHIEIWHIAVNMLALWILGPQLEAVLGRARFLTVYLVAGLTGSVSVFWLAGQHTPTLGASGAIFGLFGALLVIVVKVGGDLSQILWLLAINAVITFVVPNVSWQGHLGGFLGGALVAGLLVYAPKSRRTQLQVAGVLLVVAALAAATVARTAMLA